MTKKALNQNGKCVQEFINIIEPDFIFNNVPLNRLKVIETKDVNNKDKTRQLLELKKKLIQLKIVILK